MNNDTKFSQEEVETILKQYNFILLSKYINNRNSIKCKDQEGYIYNIRIDNLKAGYKPTLWGIANSDNLLENLNNYLTKNGTKTVAVDYQIKHSKNKSLIMVTLRCSCGDLFWLPLNRVLLRKYIMCDKCIKINHPSGVKKSTEEYIKEYKDYGYEVIDKKQKISPHKAVEIIDEYGFIGRCSIVSCRQNKHFATFDVTNNRNNFVYNANLLLSQLNIDTICNGFVSKDGLSFTCGCGEEMILTQKQFRGEKYRCDKCTKARSGLELKVKQYLIENKINFIEQYKIKDCKDKLPLPFDFYLTDYNVLIEVDGKQHFKPAFGGKESFEIRKKHDDIKNQYCKENNLSLIRIPYYDFDNNTWEKYLIDFIRN